MPKKTTDKPLAAPAPEDTPAPVAVAPQPVDTDPVKTGPDVIASYLKSLGTMPGVYRMLDASGEVIYVGKARSLKARVSNYARVGNHTNRIARMIAATASMEFVSVRTEAEALLLEANLIKRFRPRFNVLLRDDKSFPYIVIRRDHASPQIVKHRGARGVNGDYFGPFASAGAVVRTINMLQRAFLLRSCSDSIFESRTRPCLLHQIKRCAAPCTNEIAHDEYLALVDEAVRFLRGESQNVREMYQRLMEDAADKLEFERAAKFRNRLWALAHVTADQSINSEGVDEADIFACHQEGGQTCIQVFFFRTGQNWGNRAYFPKADKSLPMDEVLDSFIAQFYDDKPVPKLILLSTDIPNRALLAEALTSKVERKIEIRVPERGLKSDLVEHALTNAREALGRKLAESSSQARLLEATAERFGLASTPRRIEVYDNSHIAGTNAVGGMIVAGPEGFAKAHYRKFNIKSDTIAPGDDYGMMREVLTRRFKRLAETAVPALPSTGSGRGWGDARAEPPLPLGRGRPRHELAPANSSGEPGEGVLAAPTAIDEATSVPGSAPLTVERTLTVESPLTVERPLTPALSPGGEGAIDATDVPARPDLVLIDGGAGQLAVAREVLAALGLHDIPLIGVAKGPDRDAGREHFHIPGRDRPLMLEPRDPVLYFVQRLRDEAHRFAIGTHRAKRSKAIGINPLDEIGGIGPTRKRALLKHFGSAKSVSRAGIEDLKSVPGISAEMAERIYSFFQDAKG